MSAGKSQEGCLWRWDAHRARLVELQEEVDCILEEVSREETEQLRQAAAERLVRAVNERTEVQAEVTRDGSALLDGLTHLARDLNQAAGDGAGIAGGVVEVIGRLVRPQSLLLTEVCPRDRGALAVPVVDAGRPIGWLVVEQPAAASPGPWVRSYLEACAALVALSAGARSAEKALDVRVRHLRQCWPEVVAGFEPVGPTLTSREKEVLALVQSGLSNAAIADELYLSIETVKTHVRNLLDKHGVRRRILLAASPPKE